MFVAPCIDVAQMNNQCGKFEQHNEARQTDNESFRIGFHERCKPSPKYQVRWHRRRHKVRCSNHIDI